MIMFYYTKLIKDIEKIIMTILFIAVFSPKLTNKLRIKVHSVVGEGKSCKRSSRIVKYE